MSKYLRSDIGIVIYNFNSSLNVEGIRSQADAKVKLLHALVSSRSFFFVLCFKT